MADNPFLPESPATSNPVADSAHVPEDGPTRTTLAGGDTWERAPDGRWTRVRRDEDSATTDEVSTFP